MLKIHLSSIIIAFMFCFHIARSLKCHSCFTTDASSCKKHTRTVTCNHHEGEDICLTMFSSNRVQTSNGVKTETKFQKSCANSQIKCEEYCSSFLLTGEDVCKSTCCKADVCNKDIKKNLLFDGLKSLSRKTIANLFLVVLLFLSQTLLVY
ncbi:uncharacterized protein LOC130625521 [Hydractinia symbiolongicarpus]|uniref:uncharacterized protein LOC130625521 n=1 Tax=Hydractinia symbiolongicarpus TaxID=13093 RepID=UPI00254D37DA|nr:uncharacterized protein LOC130625521 [Hydractinia symbiolongicarpus]